MCGIDFIYLEQTRSTNTDLLAMAEAGAPEGTALAAAHQLAGRGRRERVWTDESGKCALVSVLLRAEAGFADMGLLAPMASVAAQSVLANDCDLQSKIKWPNDLMVGRKKIAGVLVECKRSAEGTAIVVGVGLNVLQTEFAPGLQARDVTSVVLSGGKPVSPRVLSEALAFEIFRLWQVCKAEGFSDVLQKWRASFYEVGKCCRIEFDGAQLDGRIAGGNDDGSLKVYLPDGTERDIVSADRILVLFESF